MRRGVRLIYVSGATYNAIRRASRGLQRRPRVTLQLAFRHLLPNGLVVLAGSEAVFNERESAKNYPGVLDRRKKLIEEGVLIENDGKYKFKNDFEFSSSSAAAAVIHGGSANGLIAWKNSDGCTLKEMEDA